MNSRGPSGLHRVVERLRGALLALRGLLAQEFERLLELHVFGLLLGRGGFGRDLSFVRGRVRLCDGVVVVARQVFGVNRLGQLLRLDLDRRRDARAEEGLARRRGPLDRRQQKAVAAAQGEELLLGPRAETLDADHVAALVVFEGRGDHLSRRRRAAVYQDGGGAVEERLLRVGCEGLNGFVAAPDGLGQRAVAYEEVRDLHALVQRAAGDAPQVEHDLLRALLLQLLQARTHVRRLAVGQAVHLDDADAARLHARLGGGHLRRAAPDRHDERARSRAQHAQLHLAARRAVEQLARVVERDVARRLAVNVLDDVARL